MSIKKSIYNKSLIIVIIIMQTNFTGCKDLKKNQNDLINEYISQNSMLKDLELVRRNSERSGRENINLRGGNREQIRQMKVFYFATMAEMPVGV